MKQMRSFVSAKKKHILSPVSKVWIFYYAVSLAIIAAFVIRLDFQIKGMVIETIEMQKKEALFVSNTNDLQKVKERLELELKVVNNTKVDNVLMRDSLQNLLSIIPEQITLSLIDIKNDVLIIKGNTPSKELFIFLLQDPLKAIFGESKVSFLELSNGTYEFTSQSKTNNLFIRNIDFKDSKVTSGK